MVNIKITVPNVNLITYESKASPLTATPALLHKTSTDSYLAFIV